MLVNFANDVVVNGKLSLIITKKLSFPELAPWPGSSMQKLQIHVQSIVFHKKKKLQFLLNICIKTQITSVLFVC